MKVEKNSVVRSATLLGHVLLLLLVALSGAAAAMVIWLFVDAQQLGQILAAGVGYESEVLKPWQAVALTLILLVQVGIWIAVVFRGRHIFTALTQAALSEASMSAGKTARLLWAMLVWGIVGHPLATVVATWHFPEGMKRLRSPSDQRKYRSLLRPCWRRLCRVPLCWVLPFGKIIRR